MNDVHQGQPTPQASSLKPRLISGMQATYLEAQWPGVNTSGIEPIGDYVLVMMDQCSDLSAGGIYLTEDQVERMNEAAESGCIMAVGDGAFTRYDDGRPWTGARPVPGDRVCIERYSGIKQMGADGHIYRVMGYRSIAARQIEPQETV